MLIERHFTKDLQDNVFDAFEWEIRKAEINDAEGKALFEQEVEVPKHWSQRATNIVASKYFYGDVAAGNGSPRDGKREWSVKQLVWRVAATIGKAARDQGLLTNDERVILEDELCWLLVSQYGSFNSPVWFNVGLNWAHGITGDKSNQIYGWTPPPKNTYGDPNPEGVYQVDPYERPQASACFILGLEDSIEGIWNLVSDSARLFKYGSGVGADWSKLRSSKDKLSGGGSPSGPVSFMRVQDATGATIKSGGKTRRAAIMQTLKVWHPDIEEFVEAKQKEEKKAWALIEQGYDGSFNGDAYGSVAFQNVNQSVRVTDDFMVAATINDIFELKSPSTGEILNEVKAGDLLRKIAEGTHICGDPGLQYEDTIQKWNPVKKSGDIESSNPCCLTGDTLVDTSEGRIPIENLVGRDDLYAFAFSLEDQLPVLRKIKKAWVAGETKKLVEVVTDKGVVIRCTPEHRFLTYEGEYIEAQKLAPGTRLRKLSRGSIPQRSDRRVLYTRENGSGEYQSRWMWEQVNGSIPEGHHIHHKNEDPTDDRLSNLEIVEKIEHVTAHSKGSANPRFIDVEDALLVQVYEYVLNMKHSRPSKPKFSPSRWNTAVRELGLDGRVPVARYEDGVGRIQGKSWDKFEERVADLANDRVSEVRVIELDEPVKVYDMEVEGVNNFFVSNGKTLHSICVHNSEYMFLSDSACNLASLNLKKFWNGERFDIEGFRHAVRIFITAMETLVDLAGYPTAKVAQNSHDFRPLGLGFSNLGALLMAMGLPYDSDEGRSVAGAIMALEHGEANLHSTRMAERVGPFTFWEKNREPFLEVLQMHHKAAMDGWEKASLQFSHKEWMDVLWREAQFSNKEAWLQAKKCGIRNAQVTVLAPTGTISFMMDCDTTGIEPELALVKTKLLAGKGDGVIRIVNETVEEGLKALKVDSETRKEALGYIEEHGTLAGFRLLTPEEKAVFATSFGTENVISWEAHLKMMAACQPFVSGAISKTINMPETATVEDIMQAYIMGWKLGLKAVAIYRENSKRSQPLSTIKKIEPSPRPVDKWATLTAVNKKTDERIEARVHPDDFRALFDTLAEGLASPSKPTRRRLPDERAGITHKFSIAGHEGYITVGLYPEDGMPGEVFITMAKTGSTINGLLDAWAVSISTGLQYGVPLQKIVDKFKGMRFEPAGFTSNRRIPVANSVMDYVARYLEAKFLSDGDDTPPMTLVKVPEVPKATSGAAVSDGPPCPNCGGMTQRAGSCYLCDTCGTSTGCG